MTNYQILACPSCNGKGCPTCQNTGKVRVSDKELQKLKTIFKQTLVPRPQSSLPQQSSFQPDLATQTKTTANLAGVIAFSILSILTGAATASWYFLKTFKPFFAALISLLTLFGTKLALRNDFFKLHQPNDFLKAIKK